MKQNFVQILVANLFLTAASISVCAGSGLAQSTSDSSSQMAKPSKRSTGSKINKPAAGKQAAPKNDSKEPNENESSDNAAKKVDSAEPFDRDKFQPHLEEGPKIDSSASVLFDISPTIGFGPHKRIEGGLFAGLVILPEGLPVAASNSIAIEAGVSRGKWDKDVVTGQRFAIVGDGRWTIKVAEGFAPYLGLGLSLNRTWETAAKYNSAAESKVRPHVKLGSFLRMSSSTALRVELDPTLEVARLGLTVSL